MKYKSITIFSKCIAYSTKKLQLFVGRPNIFSKVL